MIGLVIMVLAIIGAARVIKVSIAMSRRTIGKVGRALASLDLDGWCAEVATDGAPDDTLVEAPRKRARK